MKNALEKVNGYGWALHLVWTTLVLGFSAGLLWAGINAKIDSGMKAAVGTEHRLSRQISALADRDSIRFAVRDRQVRRLWENAESAHKRMWRAIGRRDPEPEPEYMEGWKLGPNGWEPAE